MYDPQQVLFALFLAGQITVALSVMIWCGWGWQLGLYTFEAGLLLMLVVAAYLFWLMGQKFRSYAKDYFNQN